MEELNPYAHHLGAESPEHVIAATAARLHDLLDSLTPDQINTAPGPGKWSLRELMSHLADCELVFGWRLRQILSADAPELHPFDQDAWSKRYAPIDFSTAQRTFDALREWNLLLLPTLADADRNRPAHHPERGQITFQSVLETIAGHDLHHLRLLEGLLKREGITPAYPGKSPEPAAVPSPS